jgi:predicted MPP superfamily phosphohydrolase
MPRWSRLAALGAGAAAYSFYEPYRFRLERKVVPVARPISELTVLHVSDTHLHPRNERLIRFLEGLPDSLGQDPDLVVATGDMIDGNTGIEPIVSCMSRLQGRLGRFYVLGSHDYYQAGGPGYSKYFTGRKNQAHSERAATDRLESQLQRDGWIPLKNATEILSTQAGAIRVAGVDDPYLDRHRTEHIGTGTDEILAIALVHAPDVVSEWALNGFDLVLAGHTHGGQVRIPGIGAVVTNCSLPTGLASGLNRVGDSWLHVSRGLGTGRYAPVRFACSPEASLLTIRGTDTE